MTPNHHYNPKLQHYALKNRSAMTKAEACIWKYALSRKQMLAYQFRRQRPIENYIVDFICLPLKLIIEVDGYSHHIPENEAKDRARQNRLIELGYTVVRFKDEEVLEHINIVRENIEGWIRKLSQELGK
ncbi:endonuclease domain-containing protein [Owenweeksia hongkongensis]|uniref:endonuclease domain-containing protein n=1 Tax=Owenweeksia hongkongensis TaxID=253245 RepID=UPI003A8FED3A